MHYYTNCVNWPHTEVEDLIELINNSRDITYRTFCKHVAREAREKLFADLGYDRDFPITADFHVEFRKGKYMNEFPAYYLKWSGIEFVYLGANKEGKHHE